MANIFQTQAQIVLKSQGGERSVKYAKESDFVIGI
jgi:hypothetical protein